MAKRFALLIITLMACLTVSAQQPQISGAVIDDETGDSISFASIVYKGHNISAVADVWGKYTIDRHEGWNITVSALGYKTRIIAINSRTRRHLNIALKSDTKQLEGVTIKSSRSRYSRKENPAVELMRRVVAAKKKTDLANNDYYHYNK